MILHYFGALVSVFKEKNYPLFVLLIIFFFKENNIRNIHVLVLLVFILNFTIEMGKFNDIRDANLKKEEK